MGRFPGRLAMIRQAQSRMAADCLFSADFPAG